MPRQAGGGGSGGMPHQVEGFGGQAPPGKFHHLGLLLVHSWDELAKVHLLQSELIACCVGHMSHDSMLAYKIQLSVNMFCSTSLHDVPQGNTTIKLQVQVYLDSSCLYNSPVSIFARAEHWRGEVPVDESKRRGIDSGSPLHPDQVAGQNSETSLPHLHHRAGVRLGIILKSIRTQHSKEQQYKTRSFSNHDEKFRRSRKCAAFRPVLQFCCKHITCFATHPGHAHLRPMRICICPRNYTGRLIGYVICRTYTFILCIII